MCFTCILILLFKNLGRVPFKHQHKGVKRYIIIFKYMFYPASFHNFPSAFVSLQSLNWQVSASSSQLSTFPTWSICVWMPTKSHTVACPLNTPTACATLQKSYLNKDFPKINNLATISFSTRMTQISPKPSEFEWRNILPVIVSLCLSSMQIWGSVLASLSIKCTSWMN